MLGVAAAILTSCNSAKADDVVAVSTAAPAPQHVFFVKRWHANDWANIALFVVSVIDAKQTSGPGGFLASPPICANGVCRQPFEVGLPAKLGVDRICIGPHWTGFIANVVCGAIPIFGLKGTLIDGVLGKNWSDSDRNFDAAATVAGAAVYAGSVLPNNNTVLLQQNGCSPSASYFNPFTKKCE